ncbi:MAG: NRAMP family divalent metal transporter [Candidatus Poribacteria bacterium]
MENETLENAKGNFFTKLKRNLITFLTVFGPATITAMSDNDASGVATYSVAGARLGYPIIFTLSMAAILLAITQEMGMRLTLVTRKSLADLIREKYGVKSAFFIFISLLIANIGTIIAEFSAIKVTSTMFNLPSVPVIFFIVIATFFFVTKGNYKLTQSIMLVACLIFVLYIFSAFKSKPDWSLALGNIIYPHGVNFTKEYIRNYIVIGISVLGTTITPWGQFFVSSFASDKKIDPSGIKFSLFETYWGAFLTAFFAFFMIVATTATLFVHNIPLTSGEEAALAIEPFAGKLAGTFFAIGILNAGFMGIVVVSLCTAYTLAEFFGLSGSLNMPYKQSKIFYSVFMIQLVIGAIVALIPGVSVFQIAIVTQSLNAMSLPFTFYFLIRLTNNEKIMGKYKNNPFQKYFASICTIFIIIASILSLILTIHDVLAQ